MSRRRVAGCGLYQLVRLAVPRRPPVSRYEAFSRPRSDAFRLRGRKADNWNMTDRGRAGSPQTLEALARPRDRAIHEPAAGSAASLALSHGKSHRPTGRRL
jgi:hypothetical protein